MPYLLRLSSLIFILRNLVFFGFLLIAYASAAQTDYNTLSVRGSEQYQTKDYTGAEATFKQALAVAVNTHGTASVPYRDAQWWLYFVYADVGNVAEAVAAITQAVRASATVRDEFEIKVLEDAERYADRLKGDKKYREAIALYRLAVRTRERNQWLGDWSYYKNLKAILDIRYWTKQSDSLQYYFEKIASVIPPAERLLGTHLYDWASYTIGQKQTDQFGKIERACEAYLKHPEQQNLGGAGFAEAWMAFGKLQHAKGQYERALKSFADARAALDPEKEQKLYLRSLSLSAGTYNASKKYDSQTSVVFDEYEQWNDRFAAYLGVDYVNNLSDVVQYALSTQAYARAERVLVKMMPVAEKEFGKNSSELKMVAVALSGVYQAQGKHELAKSVNPELTAADEQQFVQAMGIDRAQADLDQLQKALTTGRYAEAVVIFERSYDLLKSYYTSKKDYDGFVTIGSAVALCYEQTGDLYKAGQVLLNLKAIANAHLEPSSETHINMLLALGNYYSATGQFKEADEAWYSGMQALDKARTPANANKNDAQYYQLAERMAGLYARQHYFRDAEKLYFDVLDYHAKTEGRNSLRYQFTATALGDLYQRMGLFALASDLYEEAMPVLKKGLGENSLTYIHAVRTLANIYLLKGAYAAAEAPYLQAKAFYKQTLGTRSNSYLGILSDLGLLYTYSGRWNDAATIYHEQNTLQLERVKNLFPLLSEKEKTAFYSLTRGQFNSYYAFAMHYLEKNPQEAGELYNLQLVSKSLLLRATNRVRTSVMNSGDAQLKSLYSRWKDSREQLSKVYQLTAQQKQAAGIDERQLEKNVNELERDLTVKSELFASLISDQPDWKAIQRALQPGEAAVEMVRIEEALPEFTFDYIGKGITIDTLDAAGYARVSNLEVKCPAADAGLKIGETIISINGQATNGKTLNAILDMLSSASVKLVLRKKNSKATYTVDIKSDSVYYRSYPKKVRYGALVVTPGLSAPRYVTFTQGDELEARYARFYRNAIQFKTDDPYSYKVFWQPLQEMLGGVNKIYFSPDGVYNSINPNTLYNPETQRYVLDDVELVLVSNTADILRPAVSSPSKQAVLIGFPEYNRHRTSGAAQPSEFMLLKKDSVQRFMDGNTIAALPGTRQEVNALETLLKPKLEVVKYMAGDASEEKVKAMEAPKLLHIATHGFFLDDISAGEDDPRGVTGMAAATLAENPLLRSGLLLAGAAQTITEGRQTNQSEDGVLTAYEALNLNLHQTDMVVLSACETGLGQIQTGEGVYGLQRAFRAAGAQSVLMSLWKVDDQATQQLMTGFYQSWLNTGAKQTAFREAQLKLRKQFSHPYYWGAFVLMGQ